MQLDTEVAMRLQGMMDRFVPLAGILGGTAAGNLDEARATYLDYLAGAFRPLDDVLTPKREARRVRHC